LKFKIQKDHIKNVTEYVEAFDLHSRIDGKPIDFECITPAQPNIFNWFMNKYEDGHLSMTMKTMTNVIEARLLDKEKKEKYLQLVSLNDGI